MSNLSKASTKYYFIQGLKASGWCILIQCIVVLFQSINALDLNISAIELAIENLLSLGILFVTLVNGVYAMYGPSWYDNLVLSMGGRRKDLFWGEIIKQFTIVFVNSLLYVSLATITSNTFYIKTILVGLVLAILAGPIGIIIGFLVGKIGRYVLLFVVVIAGSFGFSLALTSLGFFNFPIISVWIIGLVAVILFILLEMWVYKLYQRIMVY